MIRGLVRFLDERSGAAPFVQKALRYLFPDNWSFLLGEVALYTFIILVGTGIYLTLFFEPSTASTYYTGQYAPLHGHEMSVAYRSAVDLSFKVRAGLLMRQTHHWAADVFVASIVLHMLRIFFTGAFRKPRDLTYYLGVTMLMLALLEGYLGYSLVDDLLSGMGLAIGYSVLMSIPFVGANLAMLVWGGPFPGTPAFESRMYVAHVFLFPILVFLILYLSPWLERRLTGEYGFHNLLDRPRDAPWRTALGVALFTWVFIIFLAGASDRVFVSFGVSYEAQIWLYRVLVFVLPVVGLIVTRRLCLALQESERLGRIRKEAEAEARGELPQAE